MKNLKELLGSVSNRVGLNYREKSNSFTAIGNSVYSIKNNEEITVTLPNDPLTGESIKILDSKGVHPDSPSYPNGFGLNNVVITPAAGQTIQGTNQGLLLDVDSLVVELQWSGNRWDIISAVNKNEAALDNPQERIGFNLEDAENVSISGIQNGSELFYDSESGIWIAKVAPPAVQTFDAYAASAGQTTASLINLNTIRHSSNIAFLNFGSIKINDTGTYLILYRFTANCSSTTRSHSRAYLKLNDQEVNASSIYSYNRDSSDGLNTTSGSLVLSLIEDDVLSLWWEPLGGGDSFVQDNSCSITLVKYS